jgi:hypothetical protein
LLCHARLLVDSVGCRTRTFGIEGGLKRGSGRKHLSCDIDLDPRTFESTNLMRVEIGQSYRVTDPVAEGG